MERDQLKGIHDEEYHDLAIIHSINRDAEITEKAEKNTLNRNLEERNHKEELEREKTLLEKVREMVKRKFKTKNREPEM